MLRNFFSLLCGMAFFLNAADSLSEEESFKRYLLELSSVFQIIETSYVEDVTPTQLLIDAIKGMVNSLDPHSAYLIDDSLKSLRDASEGEFGGLGISILYDPEQQAIYVVAPIEDTPAHRADVKPGDLIVRANGQTFYGLDGGEIINDLLKGPPGTTVTITLLRDGKYIDKEIVREIIDVKSVKTKWIEQDEGIAYVRITRFQEDTAADLRQHLLRLNAEQPVRGVILDLVSNPGGLLKAAVDVSDLFLEPDKMIVYYKLRSGYRKDFLSQNEKLLPDAKVVILINESSASASEIVAGALRENNEALLVGRQTFGKGSVQSVVPISKDTAVKLTTAFYYTPNDHKIQARGISPDIEVDYFSLKKEEVERAPFREKSYFKHLENKDPYEDILVEKPATPTSNPSDFSEENAFKNDLDQSGISAEKDSEDEDSALNQAEVRGDLKSNIFVFTALAVIKSLLSVH